jgi:hypothetical protein
MRLLPDDFQWLVVALQHHDPAEQLAHDQSVLVKIKTTGVLEKSGAPDSQELTVAVKFLNPAVAPIGDQQTGVFPWPRIHRHPMGAVERSGAQGAVQGKFITPLPAVGRPGADLQARYVIRLPAVDRNRNLPRGFHRLDRIDAEIGVSYYAAKLGGNPSAINARRLAFLS